MDSQIITMAFIFFARVLDVSIGTMRIILISRGYRFIAPILGFFEILIWLMAINTALKNLNSIVSYIIYAAGFAAGNYVGMFLEEKISIGYQSFRIITRKKASALPLTLRQEGLGVTIVDGKGLKGEVSILYTVVHKRDVKRILEIIGILEPDSFVTIEDVRSRKHGFLSVKKRTFPYILGRQIVKKK